MAGTSFFAAAHDLAAFDPRTPASKKVKLSTAGVLPQIDVVRELQLNAGDVKTVDRAIQTAVPAAENNGGKIASSLDQTTTPSLQSIRTTIQEQFDIEILLKHRELGTIEKEIAKTQAAIEQIRRCQLIPFSDSPEAQLLAQIGYKPPSANPHNIPDYAPPPEGVVDGPYTRHYRQWLISHQRFDGPNAPAFIAVPSAPGVVVNGMHQSLTGTGRPQRQSAMKVQTKNGEQVCLYRRRDGVLVKLECGDCHRSNFSSAQGFINHCRIAHQTEYSSHDAAADACGQEVNDAEHAALVSPTFRATVDGPARNTRQTQQMQTSGILTPQNSFHARGSFSEAPYYQNVAPRAQPPPVSTTRKGGRRAAMTVNTPKTPALQGTRRGSSGSAMSPTDFNTANLESHLKRKRPDINVEGLLKEVTENRSEWGRPSTLEGETDEEPVTTPKGHALSTRTNGSTFGSRATPMNYHDSSKLMQKTPMTMRPLTPTSQEQQSMPLPRLGSPTMRRPMSGMSPVPSQTKCRSPNSQHVSADGDVEMTDDFDVSSDDEDGGYRSDAVQGNDDELYSVPPRRPMQGEALEFRSGDSSTFGPMLNGSGGIFTQYLAAGATPSGLMSSFALQSGGSTLLNGGGIAPAVSNTPAVTINPAVLMRDSNGGHSPTMMNMANMTLNQESEVPKHVRFAMSGIGGDGLRKQEA